MAARHSRARRNLAGFAIAAALGACATNPATGRREIMLVSEEQEISLGQQEDRRATASYGLYEDPKLQEYVSALGKAIAARAERPDLPWAFRLADDATVNAFAAPGGFIYVTRGILAHLDSEAELVMVMGHEVGHVTARHLASQLSKQQLAAVGFGIGMVALPELQRFSSLGQAGLGLLFLKFSRDDEREADALGLRYATRLDYDPAAGARAFRMLDLLAQGAQGGRMPEWMSTHPDPGDRYQKLLAEIRGQSLGGRLVQREGYLKRLQGMVFGDDPREGFFRGVDFYHPGMRFRLRLPQGFKGQNTKQAVLGVSPSGDAVVQLTLAKEASPDAAARAFLREDGVQGYDLRRTQLNGFPAVRASFEAVSGDARVAGAAAFVQAEGRVFALLGYTGSADWGRYGRALAAATESFAPLTERWALEAEPRRIDLVVPDREMTLAEFNQRYPSTVPAREIALLNQLAENATIPAGASAKRVVGGRGLD